MRRRQHLPSALCAVAATVVLAGCGSSHPAASTSTTTGSHPIPTTSSAPASSTAGSIDQTSTCQDWASAASSARLAFANGSPELEQQINQLCQAEPNKAMAKVEDEYTTACENAQSDPSSPIDKACGQ